MKQKWSVVEEVVRTVEADSIGEAMRKARDTASVHGTIKRIMLELVENQ